VTFLFFACCDCKIYIDAGDRWAYWELEDAGVVKRRKPVDVEAVLTAEAYWNPSKNEESRWLYEGVFPPLKKFLQDHKGHRIVFGEEDEFAPIQSNEYFNWMRVGYLSEPSPRYLFEVMGFTSWRQVGDYMEKLDRRPAWWEMTWGDPPSPHELAKLKFEELLRKAQN
jgi:hypothetical protein